MAASIPVRVSARSCVEERQLRLALAAEHREVDLGPAEATRLAERPRLRLDVASGQDAATGRERRVALDHLEIARELLDRLDRPDPLDLDGHPAVVLVAAHEIDGPDVGRPLPTDEAQTRLDPLRHLRERLLEVALDAVLLEPRIVTQLVLELGEELRDADLEPVLRPPRTLADDDHVLPVLDHRGRGHPVQRLVPAAVCMDEHRAVGLEDEQADRLRQVGGEAAGVGDLAAGDDETHGRWTVAASPDAVCGRRRLYARPMRRTSWVVAVRLLLGALAFCGAWLWLGDGERILGPVVLVVAVTGLWALSRTERPGR